LYAPFGLNALMRLGSCDTLFCVYGLNSALLIPFVSACVLPTYPPPASAFPMPICACPTLTASAYPRLPRSAPTASSVACRNCGSSRTAWHARCAAAFLWLSAATAASEQTNPSASDYAAVTQAICRQYAASQRAMPYDTMYAQCMYARGYRVPGFLPSPNSPGYQGELPGPAAHNGGA